MSDKPYHDYIVMFKNRLWRNGIVRQTLYYKEKTRPPWITRLGQVRQSECLHSCYSISERHGMWICLTHGASSDATVFWTSPRRFVGRLWRTRSWHGGISEHVTATGAARGAGGSRAAGRGATDYTQSLFTCRLVH